MNKLSRMVLMTALAAGFSMAAQAADVAAAPAPAQDSHRSAFKIEPGSGRKN